MNFRTFVGGLVATLLLGGRPCPAQVVADLRGDYVAGTSDGDLAIFGSLSGTWTYASSDTFNPTLDSDGIVTMIWGVGPNRYFHPDLSGPAPYEPTAGMNIALAADEVYFHPKNFSANPRFAVARWTAAAAGDYVINGHVRDFDSGGGDGIQFVIFANGVQVFLDNSVFNDSATFSSLTVSLLAGQSIDFVIDPKGSADYDSTALAANIAVPEPPTLGLLAATLAGAVCLKRRRQRALAEGAMGPV